MLAYKLPVVVLNSKNIFFELLIVFQEHVGAFRNQQPTNTSMIVGFQKNTTKGNTTSFPEVFCKQDVCKKFAKFTGKHL